MSTLLHLTLFENLADAVAASGMDLSYNEPEAKRKIAQTQNPPPRWGATKYVRSYLTEDKEVLFEIEFEGVHFINKFDPFMAVLDDSKMAECHIEGEYDGGCELIIGEFIHKRNKLQRGKCYIKPL